jgi:hypothetical protein
LSTMFKGGKEVSEQKPFLENCLTSLLLTLLLPDIPTWRKACGSKVAAAIGLRSPDCATGQCAFFSRQVRFCTVSCFLGPNLVIFYPSNLKHQKTCTHQWTRWWCKSWK